MRGPYKIRLWTNRECTQGVVVGQGETYEEALTDIKSAIRFHIESFGEEVFNLESPVLEAFAAEAGVDVDG